MGIFRSVDYESKVVFEIGVKRAELFSRKILLRFTLTDKVEIWHVGRFRSVDYESEVVFAIGVKGAELSSRKV